MTFSPGNYWKIAGPLKLMLAFFIALLLGGNSLIIFQFARARLRTDRLTGVSQQLIAVLRLQDSLLSFHHRLNELAQSRDAPQFAREAEPIRSTLLDQTRETRRNLAYLPADFRVDPAFLTALDTIEVTLPAQLRDVTMLAGAGDWQMVRLRIDNELNRIETTTAALVKSIDRDLDDELPRVVADMRDVESRILVIVPVTAISTVFMASFLSWAIARRMMELRLEERVNERTRIARDLHDTLLQSFQGVLLKFNAVAYMIDDHPKARTMLEGAITQARRAIVEGRDAVQGLRSSTEVTNDLARSLSTLRDEMASEHDGPNPPEFQVQGVGASRDLAPLVRDDVYKISIEAVRNAFRHAQATRIDVEIHYGRRQLRLRVVDNGKGIDQTILTKGGRPGHFGLAGMNERAESMGAKLAVRARVDSGTEVELSVPASIAYGKSPPSTRP